jgi:hypothetical protein
MGAGVRGVLSNIGIVGEGISAGVTLLPMVATGAGLGEIVYGFYKLGEKINR